MKRVRISHQSDNLRDWVEANGELIGKGKDATIYALNNSAFKIFTENTPVHIKQRNVDYLLKYRDTGVVRKTFPDICFLKAKKQVPKIGPVFSIDYGIIQMKLLEGPQQKLTWKKGDNEGYMTVKKFKQTDHWKNIDRRCVLLRRVWDTRLLFPYNVEFVDFKNMENIMVNVNSCGWTTNVMFIEGGTIINDTDNALGLFFETLCDEISGRQCACYSDIMKYIADHRLR